MRVWAIIPARMGSTRLPNKVLANLRGYPLLEHVWRRVWGARLFDRVVVATDDEPVCALAERLGADCLWAGPAANGTQRVALAVGDAPVAVVNVQADLPLVRADHLRAVVTRLRAGSPIATLCAPLLGDPEDPARVKVLLGAHGRAHAFSRRPFGPPHRVHVGIYGFAPGWVQRCAGAPRTPRAIEEDLEQVAWMDAGLGIDVEEVDSVTPSVDTLGDLTRLEAAWPPDEWPFEEPNRAGGEE